MSVYNDSAFLKESIESILNQNFKNFEFLIAEDHSSDGSLKIIEEYAKTDDRICIIKHEHNRGLPYSLNELVAISRGEFIARMDSDDIALPSRLEEELAILQGDKADFVFTNIDLITEKGDKLCKSWRPKSVKKILNSMQFHNYIPHPTVMVKRNVLVSNQYNINCRRGQDTDLWRRLIKKNIRFYYHDRVLLNYRIKPRNGDESYVYADECIANNSKINALKYIKHVRDQKNRIKLYCKIFIPFFVLRLHGMTKKI